MTEGPIETQQPPPQRRIWILAAIGVIIAVTVLAYSNSFGGPFIFDDCSSIRDNLNIRRAWPVWEVLAAPPASRPIVNLSLAINYAISGQKVWSYHAFNLLVHVLGAAALFGIVRRTLISPKLRERFARSSIPLAFAVAGIWAVHPLQTAAVTYTIQRAESMMGLFYLLTIYFAIRCFSSPRRGLWYAPTIAACALGMGCKQVMVTAPLMVLLYDRTFSAGTFAAALRKRAWLYASLAVSWAILLTSLSTILHGQSAGMEVENVTPWTYALTQPSVIIYYLRLSIYPSPLLLDYVWEAAGSISQVLPEALLVGAILGMSVWGVWVNHPLGFIGAWFFLILAPSSSVLPIRDVIFEHRMYLPLASLLALVFIGAQGVCVAFGRVRWVSARSFKRIGPVAGGCLVVGIIAAGGYSTAQRNKVYSNAVTMWQDVLKKAPNNARAYNNLGVVLAEQSDLGGAIDCYRRALSIHPGYAGAHKNLGAILARQKQYAQALEHFRKAVQIRPDNHRFHYSLGKALVAEDRIDEAVACFQQSVRLAPRYGEAHYQLAGVLYDQGKLDEAITHFQAAVASKGREGHWHYNLANALRKVGRRDEAIRQYQQALKLEPDNAMAHNNLGLLLVREGRPKEAIKHYRATLGAKPNHLSAMSNLAWVLATHPDDGIRNGPEALTLAERLCAATDRTHPGYLDTLAAAYAETGQFEKAISTIQHAVKLASAKADLRAVERFHSRAKLYRQHKPLRVSR